MKPVRVLYVNGGALDLGGISAFILNYLHRMDRARVHVDVLVHGSRTGEREEEAALLGARIFHVPFKGEDAAGNFSGIKRVLSDGGYDAVHAHMDSMNAYVLRLAGEAGVPVRISHCHSGMHLTDSRFKRVLHGLVARRIPRYATHLFACSGQAARFLYGARLTEEGRVTIVPNALDTARFAFSEQMRAAYRETLVFPADGAADEAARGIVLHVGGLNEMKNQSFLLDAFAALAKRLPQARLVLVGDGAARDQLEKRAAALGVSDRVLFLGRRSDLPGLYAAADAFAFPSKFEGLGIACLEAQCGGLPCVVSSRVPPEARVLERVRVLPPDDADVWAEALSAALAEQPVRAGADRAVAAAGYDIGEQAKKLEDFYVSAVGEE